MIDKPKPELKDPQDAIVRVTLGSICTSDLHIKHGSVPQAVRGITVGHEMVGVVEEVGHDVRNVKVGDRVTVNVETFCGECFFCKRGYVNNCASEHGGWALGCRIDGGQTEYVRVPLANQGLNRIPDSVSDEQALFVGLIFDVALLGIIDCQQFSAVRAMYGLGFAIIDKGMTAVSADTFSMGISECNMADAFIHCPINLLLGNIG